DGAGGIGDVDRLPLLVARIDLDGGVHTAGRRAAYEQRNVEPLPLHLRGDVHHLIERGRDQAREPDDVDLLPNGRFEDFRRRHHDAKIDDLIIVAGEHDADDVLADVVDVALDGRHQHLAGGLTFAGTA